MGKTVVSAIVVKLLRGNFWKPISCGPWEERDAAVMRKLVGDDRILIHPEIYRFKTPASPHYAAAMEDPPVVAMGKNILLPDWEGDLIVESVGGVMVPLNNGELVSEIYKEWGFEWILVSKNYLGSINHTLLTIEFLKKIGVKIAGIVFNGPENYSSESFIQSYAGIPMIGRVREEKEINSEVIERYRDQWAEMEYWKEKIGPVRSAS